MKDLIVLTGCRDAERALWGLMSRPAAFGIRQPSADYRSHPYHDAGCRVGSADLLRDQARNYRFALVLFDLDGSGAPPSQGAESLEHELEARLEACGWAGRSACVVIEPELENWVWSPSPHVAETLGWREGIGHLRDWLRDNGKWPEDAAKPPDPKRALQAVLRKSGKRSSPALFEELGRTVSTAGCRDRSFAKLVRILKEWFPVEP